MNHNTPAILILGVFLLGTGGCDLTPPEGPLPSFEELREEFSGQPVGRGIVRVRNGTTTTIESEATHFTHREGELVSFTVKMWGPIFFNDGIDGEDLRPGMQFDRVAVLYGGPGCGSGGGGGKMEITAVEDNRIEGVFAADVTSSNTISACNIRILGGFHAIPAPPEDD